MRQASRKRGGGGGANIDSLIRRHENNLRMPLVWRIMFFRAIDVVWGVFSCIWEMSVQGTNVA